MNVYLRHIIKFVLSLFVILLLNTRAAGQDAQFSQFYANPLSLGPSFAGSTMGSRAVLNFRDQWPSIPGSFITYAASIDHYFARYYSGLGLQIYRDQAGSGNLALTSISLSYSYQLKINRLWHLRPGLVLSYNIRSLDFERLVFNDQMNLNGNSPVSVEAPTMENKKYSDAGFSLMAYSRVYWYGILIDHLYYPDQSLINGISHVPLKLLLYGGKKIVLANARRYNEENIKIAFLYKKQAEFSQLDLGTYWTKENLTFGLWYRGIPFFKQYAPGYANNDAIILMVGYKHKELQVAYSYDITVSRLYTNTSGAHEISLVYEFNKNRKVIKRQKSMFIPCAKF